MRKLQGISTGAVNPNKLLLDRTDRVRVRTAVIVAAVHRTRSEVQATTVRGTVRRRRPIEAGRTGIRERA